MDTVITDNVSSEKLEEIASKYTGEFEAELRGQNGLSMDNIMETASMEFTGAVAATNLYSAVAGANNLAELVSRFIKHAQAGENNEYMLSKLFGTNNILDVLGQLSDYKECEDPYVGVQKLEFYLRYIEGEYETNIDALDSDLNDLETIIYSIKRQIIEDRYGEEAAEKFQMDGAKNYFDISESELLRYSKYSKK